MVDGGWTKTRLFYVDSGKSQLLLTTELFPWDPKSCQDGEGQLGSGGLSGMVKQPLATAGQDVPGSSCGHHPARGRSFLARRCQPAARFCACWALTAAPLPLGHYPPEIPPGLPKISLLGIDFAAFPAT